MIKNMRTEVVCGLDIGSSSIRALIAEPVDLHCVKILGFAQRPSKGFSKGIVSNLILLSDTIEDVVKQAESIAHHKVRRLITNLSGVHIRTFKSRGSVHISDRSSEILEQDVKRCVESAKLIAMSLDREVVHLIPEKFFIDDKIEINDPLGLFASKLDVDLNIITTLVSILHNVTKAVNLAGFEVEDMLISGSATATSVLDAKELEEGGVLIDVGKDITESALFIDGKLKDCFCFPFGSDDLTQVLQDRLKITFHEAEELRIKHGMLTSDTSDVYDSQVAISSGVTSRREISNILLPKVEQIMQEIYKKITPFLKQKKRLPHIRIVGGVSKMDGFIESIEDVFGMPVSMGRIKDVGTVLYDIVFACSLGLAKHAARKRIEKKSRSIKNSNNFVVRFASKIRDVLSEYF